MRSWLLAPAAVLVVATPARAHRLNVEARLEAGRAVVEVYFGDGTTPAGAEVLVTRDGVEVARGRTDATGRFWFTPAAPGRHAIAVTEPGLHRGQAALDVGPGDLAAPVTTAARAAGPPPPRGGVDWRGLLLGLAAIGALAAGLAALQRARGARPA